MPGSRYNLRLLSFQLSEFRNMLIAATIFSGFYVTCLAGNLLAIVVVIHVDGVAVVGVVGHSIIAAAIAAIVIIVSLGIRRRSQDNRARSRRRGRGGGHGVLLQLLIFPGDGPLLFGLVDGLSLALDNVDFHLDAMQLGCNGL